MTTVTKSTVRRDLILAVFLGLIGLAVTFSANAGPMHMLNTSVQGSDGNTYSYIGDAYQTTGMSFANVGGTDTITFTTAFNGTDNVNGYNVGYADVFIGGMAISLGDEGANGGLGAGLYQTSSYATSKNIWGQRSGIIYGQGVNYNGTTYDAPTVLTGGTFLENVSITSALVNGFFDLSISFADTAAFENQLAQYGVFWGTGDCSNGAVYADVPEPASIAMMLMALTGFWFMVRPRQAIIRRIA